MSDLPEREETAEAPLTKDGKTKPARRSWQERPIVAGALAGFLVGNSTLIPTVFLLNNGAYAYWLFFGVPLVCGFLSSITIGWKKTPTTKQCYWAALWSLLTLVVYLLGLRFEGIACILMSLPIGLPVAMLGAVIGYAVVRAVHRPRLYLSVAVIVPFALIAMNARPAEPNGHTHVSRRVIDAPPQRVWPYLFELHGLPAATEWPFRLGMAFPLGTRSKGDQRACILSTGTMPERIIVREPNRRLKFQVLWTPPSMKETNPFGPVHSRHNEEAFQCLAGQFELTPLPGNRTLIRATTWYRHEYAPDGYWTLWTDATVAAVHHRVLDEIARRAAAP